MIDVAFLNRINGTFATEDAEKIESAVEKIQEKDEEQLEPIEESVEEMEDAEKEVETKGAELSSLVKLRNYVRTNGANNSIIETINDNGEFTQLSGILLPSSEKLGRYGDPDSTVSQLVVEGLEGFLKDAYDWAKRMVERIMKWINKLLVFLHLKAATTTDRVNRIKKQLEKLGDVTVPSVKMIPTSALRDVAAKYQELMRDVSRTDVNIASLEKTVTEKEQAFKDLSGYEAECKNVGTAKISNEYIAWINSYQKDIDEMNDLAGKFDKEARNLSNEARSVGGVDNTAFKDKAALLLKRVKLAHIVASIITRYQSFAFMSVGRWILAARKVKK